MGDLGIITYLGIRDAPRIESNGTLPIELHQKLEARFNEPRDPYRILVAEVMLTRTNAGAAQRIYREFILDLACSAFAKASSDSSPRPV
ncbi:MAG: hypothetical protein ACTSQZ_06140 [Candidatus Thorarchaeota archaeon]